MRLQRVAGLGTVGICIAAAAAALVAAAEPAAQPDQAIAFTLADLALGDHVSGENLTPDSLKHHVVLLALWTQMRKSGSLGMPALEQVHRALGPAGLQVVGLHVDRGAVPEVRRAALELGLTFPIFDGGSVQGFDLDEPPVALLFDHTGKCIAQGTLAEVAARAGAVVNAAPPAVLAGRRLDALKALERMLRDEAKYGAALRKVEPQMEDEDGPTAEEAKYVVERLRAHGEGLLARAEAVKSDDAPQAFALLQRVALAYRGDAIGRKATDWQREWKREKAFSDGLRAAGLIGELEALRAQALARPAGGRPRAPGTPVVAGVDAANSIPPPVKAQLAQLVALVRQLSPGSKSADRAEQIALELGLQLPAAP